MPCRMKTWQRLALMMIKPFGIWSSRHVDGIHNHQPSSPCYTVSADIHQLLNYLLKDRWEVHYPR